MNNDFKQSYGKEGSIVWKSVVGLLLLPVLTAIAIPLYSINYGFETSDWVCFIVLYAYTGLSITMGYHRLWSHKTYKANKFISYILLIGGTAALQNSVLQWSSDHRKHHKDVDNPIKDPYAATKGFWYSHFGWLLVFNTKEIQKISHVNDLLKDKVIVFQDKYYVILATLSTIGLPILFALLTDSSILGCFILGGLLRIVVVHHITFCINSLAHKLGDRPYSTRNTARDSFITALITGGEGYHNYHHAFAGDYRNGIRFFDFDPSKWLIALFAKFGWCYDLKTTPKHLIEIAKAKVKLEKALNIKDEKYHFNIQEKYKSLVKSVKEMSSAKIEYLKAKKETSLSKADIKIIKAKYKALKLAFFESKKNYNLILA